MSEFTACAWLKDQDWFGRCQQEGLVLMQGTLAGSCGCVQQKVLKSHFLGVNLHLAEQNSSMAFVALQENLVEDDPCNSRDNITIV